MEFRGWRMGGWRMVAGGAQSSKAPEPELKLGKRADNVFGIGHRYMRSPKAHKHTQKRGTGGSREEQTRKERGI